MDKTIERLHRVLVDAIRNERGDDFDSPVTISEIYQKLVPYRAAREAIGFDMNADYEHALLRLLAGEGDFARVEPGEVRETFRLELDSPNPNVSLFREYANCDVWIAPSSGDFANVELARLDATSDVDDEVELAIEPEEPAPPPASTPISRRQDSGQQTCGRCGGKLPSGRQLNFCPFCGHDLTQRSCAKCGELLDPAWRFCVNCGTPA